MITVAQLLRTLAVRSRSTTPWPLPSIAIRRRDRQRCLLQVTRLPPARHAPPAYSTQQAPTNGKAERLVQTSLREWFYASSYASSEQRSHTLRPWLHHYNWHRPHASLGYRPPISRIPLNNVLAAQLEDRTASSRRSAGAGELVKLCALRFADAR